MYTTEDWTVTLAAIQTFGSNVDLVRPYDNKPNGAPDTSGLFSLAVTRTKSSRGLPAPPPVKPADLPLKEVTLTDFKLAGNLSGDMADFTLTGDRASGGQPGRHAGFALRPGGADRLSSAHPIRTHPRRTKSFHPGL